MTQTTDINVKLADAEAATAQDFTAVDLGKKTPYLPGRTVSAHFVGINNTGTAPVYAVDGSDDNSSWTELVTSAVQDGHDVLDVICQRYMRGSVTTASGTLAGVVSIYLEPNG